MTTRTTIKMPMYSCVLVAVVTDNVGKFVKALYKKYGIVDTVGGEAEGIILTPDIDRHYLVISSSYLSHNTIAHEIHHATMRITGDRGIKDEEAQAWLAGHISSAVYKFLDRKKLKVKHG